MNGWMKEFLSRSLADIPAGSYRRQLEGELTDHLTALAEELEGSGLPVEEARACALARMGEPENLNRAYLQFWQERQLKDPFHTLGLFWASAVVAGFCYILTLMLLGSLGFTNDAVFAGQVSYPLYNHPEHQLIFSPILFFLPFTAGAISLRRAFRGHSHCRGMVTAGLVFIWAGEKLGLVFLNSLVCGVPMAGTILRGSAEIAPWLNLPYALLTLAGCFLLGALAGRRGKEPGCQSGTP